MPGLFAAISEAADWCEASTKGATMGHQAIQTWDWLTVGVYTCDQGCGSDDCQLACMEEVVHVYNEE